MIKLLRPKPEAAHHNKLSAQRCCRLRLIGIAFALLIALPLSGAAQQPKRVKKKANEHWLGVFTFEDAAPAPKRRRRTDVTPFVSYEISVRQDADGELTATFTINGMQMFEAYRCLLKASGENLEFYYEQFVADGAPDSRKFRRGERLFSLTAIKAGRKTKYLFQPAAYKITRLARSAEKPPVYFVKPPE